MAERQGLVDTLGRGHVQDITGDGLVRTRLELGDLAMVTMPDGNWTQIGSASSNIVYVPPGPLAGAEANPAGVPGGAWYWNMADGTSGEQRGLRTGFYGRALGLRYRNREPSGIDLPTWAVCIDGKVYPVPRQATYFDAQPQPTLTASGGITAVLIDGDLEDRWHTVDVIVTGNPTNNNRLALYGFYLDRRYYRESQPSLSSLDPVAVPVSPTAALAVPLAPSTIVSPNSAAGPDRNFMFVDHLLFTEMSGTDGEVVIARSGVQIDRLAVPGHGGAVWPRRATGRPLAIDGAYTVQVPAGGPATINLTVFGGK